MKKKFTFLIAALALLTMINLPGKAVGQSVVSGTTYSTTKPSNLPTGWSGQQNTSNNSSYFSLTYNTDYIQTASFEQTGFSSIKLKARKYGGPTSPNETITVSWYNSDKKTETVLGTIAPTTTTLKDYTISSPATVAAGTGYVKIQCKNAGSNKGSAVSEVTLTFTNSQPSITVNSTLTVTPVAVTDGELSVSYNNIAPASGTITLFDAQDNDITSTCDWFFASFNNDFSKVTYTASENTSGAVNSLRMHLHVINGSAVADADVSVSQDFILTTMDQICTRATANGNTAKDVTIRFNNWVVSGVNNSNYQYATKAWLTDGTKGCVIFGNTSGSGYPLFKTNDKLSGTVNCKLQLYTGYPQISTIISGTTAGLNVTNDGTITAVTNKTIADLTTVNTGSVVTLNGLVCQSASYNTSTGYILSDGTNTINVKRNTYSFELTQGSSYNVTGIFEYYSSNKYLYPRSAADVTEVTTPAISVVQSLTSFTYCVGAGPSTAQSFTVSGSNLEGNITLEMSDGQDSAFEISLSEGNGYTNTLTLTQTSNAVAETPVYVRMKEGLPILPEGYSDAINITSTNATTATVNLTGTVTAPKVTWDLTTNSYSSASATSVTWPSSYVTMENAKGQSSTNANSYIGGGYNSNNLCTHTRFYQNHVLTFTPALGYAISSIEITATDNTYAGYFTSATWSNATASNANGKVTVTPTNGNNSVSATINTATRATSVTVYYEASTLTPHNITNDVNMANGTVVANPVSAVAGATVTLTIYPAAGYYLEDDDDIEVDGTSTVTLTKVNAGKFTFTMPDEDVTVHATFSAYTGTYYTLVNNTADLIPGRHYIIATSKEAGDAYVMAAEGSGYREAVLATVVGNTIYQTTSVHEIVLSGDNTNFYTLYDDGTGAASQGYLYAAGNENKLNVNGEYSTDDKYKWAISIDGDEVASIVSQVEGSNAIKFNNTASPKRFSCYASGQQSVYLYMKGGETTYDLYSNTTYNSLSIGPSVIYTVHNPAILEVTGTLTNDSPAKLIIEDGAQLITNDVVEGTIKKNISAWTTTDPVGGWHFISYPLNCDYNAGGDAPNTVAHMIPETAANYDLYELLDGTWANYKEDDNTLDPNLDPNFGLFTGHGYLYANANNVTLEFVGSLNFPDPEISLEYGWNLVGNPYTYNAYPSLPYYKMNAAGTAVTASDLYTTSDAVAPCTGILVNNTSGATEITFTKTAPGQNAGNNGNVQMVLTQTVTTRGAADTETLDNAIVSFNKGSQLEKFYFGTQNANIYLPQGNKEYAIVSAGAQGEMPVNFKANQSGEYTISVNTTEVEMSYLHLIDNITGADVDLLATPSYTFNARNDAYASRFRLVFSANSVNENGNDNFAFISDGQIILTEQGNVQVYDVMGRMISSHNNVNHFAAEGMAAGVYVIRLTNGNDVMTQKIVVK